MRKFLYFLSLSALLLSNLPTNATHIVGGELYYTFLGGNRYEFTLVIYRDCINGRPWFDDPAYIGVFDSSNTEIRVISIDTSNLVIDTVPLEINDPCTELNALVCYQRGRYTFEDTLSMAPGGLTLAYDRCCWNGTVSNLVLPLEQGLTVVSYIPDTSLAIGNSSPYFNKLTPPFLCLNQPLEFDHSATDPDGDSLVYEVFTPFNIKGSLTSWGPPDPPPYQALITKPPNLPLAINPVTGLLTSFPTVKGQFVFGVRVKEYRNGQLIGETSRSYQFNIEPCSRVTDANFPNPIIQCGDTVVTFGNNSVGAISYQWHFGDPNSPDTGSNSSNPTHIYSGNGNYTVQLIAYSDFGTPCNDTSYGSVQLYPELTGDFSWEDEVCDNFVQFTDQTPNTSGNVTTWQWTFGDGNGSSQQNPYHYFDLGADPRTFIVTLLVENENGCVDSIFYPYTGSNRKYSIDGVSISKSIVYPRGDSTMLSVDAQNAVSYIWEPIESVTDPYSPTTYAKPKTFQRYKVTVTDNRGCKDDDFVDVRVYEYSCSESDIYVPNAFSPNGDGANDFLRVRGEELRSLDFAVYNRLGELVFESSDLNMTQDQSLGWDGTFKGRAQDAGVYVYHLKARCSDEREFTKKGNVTLLR